MSATVEARKDITVQDLYEMVHSDVYVLSGFNGKLIAKPYRASKHYESVGKRIVHTIWADFKENKAPFGSTILPVICVYVDGTIEYEQHRKKQKEGK